jgi:hypothetical protein
MYRVHAVAGHLVRPTLMSAKRAKGPVQPFSDREHEIGIVSKLQPLPAISQGSSAGSSFDATGPEKKSTPAAGRSQLTPSRAVQGTRRRQDLSDTSADRATVSDTGRLNERGIPPIGKKSYFRPLKVESALAPQTSPKNGTESQYYFRGMDGTCQGLSSCVVSLVGPQILQKRPASVESNSLSP